MEYRRLGHSEIDVSTLCLGSMTWGEQNSPAEGHAQMDCAIAHGINFIDTAEAYPIPMRSETQGRTEAIIGSWLAERRCRDRVIIATKVCGRSDNMAWMRHDGASPRLSRAQIMEAVDGSLRRLGTDYIDLYQIHWPDRPLTLFGGLGRPQPPEPGGIAIEETLAIAEELIKAGKIRLIGVSNETPWGVMRWLRAAENNTAARIASIQNGYNLINRCDEHGLTEIVYREAVGFLAYSPLGQGYLSGKYLDGAVPDGSRKACFGTRTRYEAGNAENAIRAYVKIAAQFGLDPSAMANQFVTSRPFVTSNIFGARTLAQLEIALSSLDITISSELEAALEAVHLRYPNPCP